VFAQIDTMILDLKDALLAIIHAFVAMEQAQRIANHALLQLLEF